MPLLVCPNDNAAMQTVARAGVEFDFCPTCRGVWLDRGELEKLMSGVAEDESLHAARRAGPRTAASGPFARRRRPRIRLSTTGATRRASARASTSSTSSTDCRPHVHSRPGVVRPCMGHLSHGRRSRRPAGADHHTARRPSRDRRLRRSRTCGARYAGTCRYGDALDRRSRRPAAGFRLAFGGRRPRPMPGSAFANNGARTAPAAGRATGAATTMTMTTTTTTTTMMTTMMMTIAAGMAAGAKAPPQRRLGRLRAHHPAGLIAPASPDDAPEPFLFRDRIERAPGP